MQRRYKHDLVAVLQFVLALALELPVRVVYEHKDARPSVSRVSQLVMGVVAMGRGYERRDVHCVLLDEQLRALCE